MTTTDRSEVLSEWGYSPEERKFVAACALHSGYFLARQYQGGKGSSVVRLTRKVQRLGHADVETYGYGTRLYHIHSVPLYSALGQENNRHRRTQKLYRIYAKLMGFDYVLLHPEYRFLPTEEDKIEYFCTERGLPLLTLPSQTYTGTDGKQTERFCIDKMPIRVDPATGVVAFCFMDSIVFSDSSFATWLDQYTPLIRAVGNAEVVYVANTETRFPAARREFEKRRFTCITDADLIEYFTDRKAIEEGGRAAIQSWTKAQHDLYRARKDNYSGAAFDESYAAWKLGKTPSVATSNIKFSTYLMPHSYAWLGTVGKQK